MYKRIAVLLCFFVVSITAYGQEISGHWMAVDEENNFTKEYIDLKPDSTYRFSLFDGAISSSGKWTLHRNVVAVTDTVENKTFGISFHGLTDSTLTVVMLGREFAMVNENNPLVQASRIVSAIDNAETSGVVAPSEGITFAGIIRGAIGLVALVFILFLFSDNRKAISWKLVGVGLGAQILIALGIQKVPFIGTAFEWVSRAFVKILDFSGAGAEFLFGGLLDQTHFGYIFAFQVLPTIIFFSALTSVLFYLGVIQKVVGYGND